jgi:hypothetical protein
MFDVGEPLFKVLKDLLVVRLISPVKLAPDKAA